MYVLGINAVYHESSACLLRDGSIVAMAEEERFNRIKHGKKPRIDSPDQLPVRALRYCLDAARIDLGQVAFAGYSSDPARWPERQFGPGDFETEIFVTHLRRAPARLAALGFKGEFKWIDHHTAHAASAYYASPFDDAAVLTVDGIGDSNSTASFKGVKNTLSLLQDVKLPNSLGFLWELASMFLGFDIYDATKIMGLAAYGDPKRYAGQLGRLVRLAPEGKFETDNKLLCFDLLDYQAPTGYFHGLEKLFGVPKREPGQELTQPYQDIAAALQQRTDEVVLHLARHLHQLTGSDNLCLAGGVALNCVTNQFVFEGGPFTGLFVQPACHDAGTALGAAAHIWHHLLGNEVRRPMEHAYFGPAFSTTEIESALQDHQLSYARSAHVEQAAAQLLAQGHILGFFQGRMEIGPRALGNRSLLADPRNPNMRDILNHKVKHREYFRPFAPSVLAEEAGNWFHIAKDTSASEFMLMAYPVKEPARDQIPAVIHVDGTSRIQAVRRDANPRYHQLISEFHRITGVPMVLNTSFNDSEPIVCAPQDAIQTFLKTEIDYLVIDDFIVGKADNREAVESWRRRNAPALHGLVKRLLHGNRLTPIESLFILTDGAHSARPDAVSPLFPEHQFFLDELVGARIKGASVLDVGSGPGVLAIAAVKAGARQVTALESSPRARAFAGFNIVLNRCADRIEILDGGKEVFAPVAGRRFDYIIADPPFLPAPARKEAGAPAGGDPYGLDRVAEILKGLDRHLTAPGHAQVVTFAPGNETGPLLLLDLVKRFLPGTASIKVSSAAGTYARMVDWMLATAAISRTEATEMQRQARTDGVSHIHLCMVHYEKGAQTVTVSSSVKEYADFQMPLTSIQPD